VALLCPVPLQLKNWDWKLKAVAFEAVDDVLKGVGFPASFHVDDASRNFALHVRRRSTVEEAALFVERKARGDYNERLLAKGIV